MEISLFVLSTKLFILILTQVKPQLLILLCWYQITQKVVFGSTLFLGQFKGLISISLAKCGSNFCGTLGNSLR